MPATAKSPLARCLWLLLLAGSLFLGSSFAQYSSGLSATVADPSGAVIPNATCTAVNQETGVTQSVQSNNSGFCNVLHLAPGKYRFEVEAVGFIKWVQTDVVVEGGDVRSLYPQLKLGQKTESIEVAADAEMLETTHGSMSRTLETKTVQESPLIGQNLYASVATLAPGLTGLGDASGSIAAAGSLGTNSYSSEAGFQINGAGQRQEANEFQVDGSTVNGNSRDGVVNLTPNPDTVAEMKVSAATYSAEKGRQSGALIEVFTKSGTNKFHGSLSEMHTDSLLTARTEFQDKVPHSVRNDFGGTIGGPIFKNRTFFFGSLFWMRSHLGSTFLDRVETKEFSDYVIQNYPDSMAARFFKQAPPGAWPTSDFQSVADVKNLWWTMNTPPSIPNNLPATGMATINTSPQNNGFQGHIRIDHNFAGGNDKLFYSLFRNSTEGEHADARPKYAYINPNGTWYNKINYLHTFGPTLMNEFSVTYNRLTGNQPDKIPELPNAAWIGGVDATYWQWGPSGWVQNNWYIHDNLSWAYKAHNFRIGMDVDRLQDLDDFTNGNARPYFMFLNILDFASDQPFDQNGPVLDVRTGGVAHNLYQRVMMFYAAPYIQDDWKINRRLTLNLGLRFDYFGHLSTVTNGNDPLAFFTPGAGATFADQVASGSMQVRGSNGAATKSAQYRLAPRIGFAWDVFGNGTTSLRGGYGIFNDRVGEYSYVNNMRTNPPHYATPSLSVFNPGVTSANFSYGISTTGAQGFAPPPGITYTVDEHGGLAGTRTAVGGIDPNLKSPMVHSWSLGLQQKFYGLMLEADYFGSASRKLYLQTDVNRFAGDMIVNGGLAAHLNQSFNSVTYGRSIGIANSNLAAFSVTRHYTRGLTVHAIYTFGKSLDLTSSNDNGVGGGQSVFDAQTMAGQYARSDYDSRHRFSADAVWSVPAVGSGFARVLTDGWTLSPVIILQSGQPFTVYTSAGYSSGGDYNADGFNYDIPNVPVFGRHIHTSRSDFLNGLFTVADFPVPTSGTQGNLGRNTYDGPGYAQVNLAVQRSFKLPFLGEAGKLEMRGEFFNLFNRVNLTDPVSDLSNSSFGKSLYQHSPRQIQLVGHIRF